MLHRLTRNHTRQGIARTTAAILFTIGSATGLAACTIDRNDDAAAAASSSAEAVAPRITMSVDDQETGVEVTEDIVVKGTVPLTKVTMTNDAGEEIAGTLSSDRMSWKADPKLGYGRTYSITAKAGSGENTTTATTSFTTVSPQATSYASLAPLDGATVGVGQSIALRFDSVINDRKAVQDAITITTEPKVEGAFYWISNQEVRWRPENYWAPGTTVTVDADLYGRKLGGGVYGEADQKATFTIGDDVRATVDDNTKIMTITKNGEVINTMPVSNGRDGGRWATPHGTYVVGDQHESLVMDSNTFGVPESAGGYVTPVKYATQMSYSGIYIHAAPWSEWAQGSQNTSHGCVNVSTANAQWVYNNLKRGDVVVVKHTSGPLLSGYDGLGDWNIDWATWKAGNVNG